MVRVTPTMRHAVIDTVTLSPRPRICNIDCICGPVVDAQNAFHATHHAADNCADGAGASVTFRRTIRNTAGYALRLNRERNSDCKCENAGRYKLLQHYARSSVVT
jgi:hypothetical protein